MTERIASQDESPPNCIIKGFNLQEISPKSEAVALCFKFFWCTRLVIGSESCFPAVFCSNKQSEVIFQKNLHFSKNFPQFILAAGTGCGV